ncbi:hypothetical protein AGJ34_22005 [Cronobacter dublinensis subsp. dublinensis]|nr:hypothetical protein [Cronobacter dublinensis subsp. dublinensis]EGT5729702.1 hypothetical protein [Cronobacter dublinensis subsp. dublinensis]
MRSRLLTWLNRAYWIVLTIMIVVSVTASVAIRKSPDMNVYLTANREAAYNINWLKVIRDRNQPDITMIVVNVPGTNDKAHMRVIAYPTAMLSPMNASEIKNLLQRDSEASMAGHPVTGKLIDMEPTQAQMLYYDTKGDMILFGLLLFSIPETVFLIISTCFLMLRHILKGKKRTALVICNYWAKTSYFLSFASMCAGLALMSFPVIPSIIKLFFD